MELKLKVIKAWKKAFLKGTKKAWADYKRTLKKLAEEAGASSPEALQEWALTK